MKWGLRVLGVVQMESGGYACRLLVAITQLLVWLRSDDECEMAHEIDVPKALGDIFESLAGAIFVDSGSLDTVWRVFYRLMKNEIDAFSKHIPKQPIRQIHETFPQLVKFEEVTLSENGTGRIVMKLTITGHRNFFGCGYTKKSAKNAAAKHALKYFGEKQRK